MEFVELVGRKELARSWVEELFLEKAHLVLKFMDKRWSRASWDAAAIAELLRKHGVGPGSRILDLGCGNGRIAVNLAKHGYHVTGVDLSPLFIEDACRKAVEHGVADQVEFLVCDARRLTEKLGRGEFDAVINVWNTILGYESVEDDLQVLREARAVTRDEGLLLVLDTISREQAAFIDAVVGGARFIEDLVDDYVLVEEPRYDPVTGSTTCRWIFYRREGRNLVYVDELEYRVKLYSLPELAELAGRAGWKLVAVYGDKAGSRSYRPALDGINAVFQAAKH